MSYTSGNASNSTALADALRAFCLAEGMTINRFEPGGLGDLLNISHDFGNGEKFFNFNFDDEELQFRLSTGYADVPWGSQPGESGFTHKSRFHTTGPYTGYEIFYSDNCLMMVIEFEPSSFTYLAFGEVTKYGAYGGGEFMAGASWRLINTTGAGNPDSIFNNPLFGSANSSNLQFACDQLTNGNYFHSASGSSTRVHTSGWGNDEDRHFQYMEPNASNGEAILLPLKFFMVDDQTSKRHPVGHLPSIRQVNMRDLSPKEVIQTDFVVYPLVRKVTPAPQSDSIHNSGNYGLAIKKVV